MLTIEGINVVLPGLFRRHEVTYTFVASWIYDELKLIEFKIAQFMNKGCQRVGVSKGRSADQTPIPCVPVASPGFKPKGRVFSNSGALKPDKLKLA